MHESDANSDDGSSATPWCEICETNGHDILSCTSMFGADAQKKDHPRQKAKPTDNEESVENGDTSETSGEDESEYNSFSHSVSSHGDASGPRKAVLEGLKGASGGSSTSLPAVAGKASKVVDDSKWCALCERDGHESIDCPFDD